MNADKLAALKERATHLTAIKNSPSWPILKAILEEQVERKVSVMCAPGELDDSKLHHLRGHVHGLRYVLAIVDGGEEAFQKAVAAAQQLEGDDA